MYYLVKNCKTKAEAIEKSGVYIGQPARVFGIHAHGNVDGVWTVIPRIELLQEEAEGVGTGTNLRKLKPSTCQEKEY